MHATTPDPSVLIPSRGCVNLGAAMLLIFLLILPAHTAPLPDVLSRDVPPPTSFSTAELEQDRLFFYDPVDHSRISSADLPELTEPVQWWGVNLNALIWDDDNVTYTDAADSARGEADDTARFGARSDSRGQVWAEAKYVHNLLVRLAKYNPQALYYSLRTSYLEIRASDSHGKGLQRMAAQKRPAASPSPAEVRPKVDEGDVAGGEDVDENSGDIDIDGFVTTDGGSGRLAGSSDSRGSFDDSINPYITLDDDGFVDDADAADLNDDGYWTWPNAWAGSWTSFWSDEDMADGEGVDEDGGDDWYYVEDFHSGMADGEGVGIDEDSGDSAAAGGGGERWQDPETQHDFDWEWQDDYYAYHDADFDWAQDDIDDYLKAMWQWTPPSVTAGLADTTNIDSQETQRFSSIEADSSGAGGPGLSESAAQARGDNFPWTGCTDVGIGVGC